MADVFDPNIDPEQFAIQQALVRAAALRKQPAPVQSQMVGDRYVKAPKLAAFVPILNGLVADNMEQKAVNQQQELTNRQREALGEWLKTRPTTKTVYGAGEQGPTMKSVEPTEADTTAWASQGLKNPLGRTLASKVLEDQVVQAPIRAEKAQDKKDNTLLVNQRYDEDRKARAQLAAENSKNRIDMLQMRLTTVGADTAARLELQRQLANENNALRKYQIDAGIEQKGLDRDLKQDQFIQKLNAATGKGKGLSATQQKELAELQDEYRTHTGYAETFKDTFSGPKAAVQAQLGGTFLNQDDPEAAEVAEWWRNFRAGDNVIRHGLYGSALTATEQEAWKRTTVSPLSSPKQIKDAIATRAKIANDKLESRLKLYTEGALENGTRAAPPAPPTRASALPRSTGSSNRVEQPTGSFTGSAEQIMDAINSIADPVERDNARRAYANQMASGTKPPAAPAAPPKTLKWTDLK